MLTKYLLFHFTRRYLARHLFCLFFFPADFANFQVFANFQALQKTGETKELNDRWSLSQDGAVGGSHNWVKNLSYTSCYWSIFFQMWKAFKIFQFLFVYCFGFLIQIPYGLNRSFFAIIELFHIADWKFELMISVKSFWGRSN